MKLKTRSMDMTNDLKCNNEIKGYLAIEWKGQGQGQGQGQGLGQGQGA